MSCNSLEIKSGDLVFVDDTSSNLSKAINDVTKKEGNSNYTHVGICVLENNEVFVYHADPQKNVVKEPLTTFLNDRKKATVHLYRMDEISKNQLKNGFAIAEKMIGKSYDYAYRNDNDKIYCSELIYEMFKQDTVFKMNPMTFKDIKTGEFHKNWIEHYQKLGVEIPEGELGCNPNDMSKNRNLRFLKTISLN